MKSILNARKDFLALEQTVYSKPLVYLDSAATAQKPQCVIDAMNEYYQKFCGNVHRGAHYLSEIATAKYNQARKDVADFISADDRSEVIFTRSTTESINLVASCLGQGYFKPGDEIILTQMEHHSNIVPWWMLKERLGVILKVAPIFDDGSLDLESFKKLFGPRTKLAAFTHASNALGTINPVKEMVEHAKSFAVPTLIDGAQAIHHLPVDVTKIGCDFYAFSGHKAYGPTGIGILYAKKSWLEKLPPYQGGGDMIESVDFEKISFAKGPQKFEAGTPNIAGALGLAQALKYIKLLDLSKIHAHEQSLLEYGHQKLKEISGIKIMGEAQSKVSLISFTMNGVHPHDISTILDREGVAIRAGHLCAEPLMKRFKVSAFCRASFALYNNHEDIDQLALALNRVFEVFK